MSTASQNPDAEPKVIAVVGSSSGFGALLLMHLEKSMPQCQLVAIDYHPLRQPVKRVSAYRMEANRSGVTLTIDDIPEVMQTRAWDMVLENRRLTMADVPDVFNLEFVDSVVHVGSFHDGPNPEEFVSDIGRWVEACRMAGIRQFVYLSDVRVYGNHRENPIPITERTQPSPAAEHRFLLEAESEIRQNAGATTLGHDLTIAALRPTMTAGPSGSSPITDDLLWPMIASNRKRSIPIQMLHEQDFARAIQLTMERRLEGAYNLTSKGVIGSEQALEMCRSVMVAKPVGAKRRRGSRGSGFGRHPLIVSDTKFRHAAGFTAKYSTEQAARAYCHSYLHEVGTQHVRPSQ